MRRIPLIALCLALGCGASDTETKTPSATPAPANDSPVEALPAPGEITMQDINLYLHDTAPTVGAMKKPSFWVSAKRFSMQENGLWLFEEARAVAYGENENEEDIIMEAARGSFEEGKGAVMEGGVVAHAGTMTLHLDNITWKNPENGERGVAYSEVPLTIEDTDLQLSADSVHLYPKDKHFEMTRVAGSIYVGSLSQ